MRGTPRECDISGTEPIRPGHGETLATLESWAATGELQHIVADVFLPSDMMSRRALRAAALATIVPPHAIVTGQAAAWVWGGPLMRTLRVLLPPHTSRRVHAAVVTTQDSRVPDNHRLGIVVSAHRELLVTTPTRTVIEIVDHEDLSRPCSDAALAWLMSTMVTPNEVYDMLAFRWRYPGARHLRDRAEEFLTRWAQPEQR